MTAEVFDLLYLADCALHRTAPDADWFARITPERLYALSRFHSMSAIGAMGLEEGGFLCEKHMPASLVREWKESKAKAIRKNLLLDGERKKLFSYLEQSGIWYMPLKGSVLKKLYPKVGMREMADNDILYDVNFQKQVQRYMKSCGYRAVSVGKSNHDVYEKPPVYNFEMHSALFHEERNKNWAAYYGVVQERLIPNDDVSFGCHFSDEDFYLYMMTHACKHYNNGGTGLRSLVDCYVYLWRKGGNLDWNYIEREVEKLEITEFEKKSRILSRRLLDHPEGCLEIMRCEEGLTAEEKDFLMELAASGTYGTTEITVAKKLHALQTDGQPIRRRTKWKYLCSRVFPDLEWFRQFCPFCYRHRWSIPFFLVYRVVRGLLRRSAHVRNELEAVYGADRGKEEK